MDVDLEVLSNLIDRMAEGKLVKPTKDEETTCFQLIKDLDHVGGFVKGSVITKKYMRNEIWSLISFADAPSWFITFASHKIKVNAENNSGILGLRGTVYHGDNHFISRFISSNGTIWYHDGITTGRQYTEERNLCMTNSEYFIRCKEKDFTSVYP